MKKYFEGRISPGFVSLYTGKSIIAIASGLLGIFFPIFLFEILEQNFALTLMYFIVGYTLYPLFLFFGIRFLNKFGFRRALRTSVFFGAFYYAIFYFIEKENLLFLLPLSLLMLTLFRFLYWVPYHVDFAKFTDKRNRGKQLSTLRATRSIIGIFIPLIAGWTITRFGFDVVFAAAVAIFLTSLLPYVTIPRTREKFSWSYRETFDKFFSKKHRKQIIAFMADGAEVSTSATVWPIFIFLLLNGDYLKVGFVSTVVVGATVILQLFIGKSLDKTSHKEKVLRFGTMFSSISWVIKIFIATAFHVFLVGTFHNIMKIFTRLPFDTLTYEIAADEGHYVDEFTILHEIAVSVGRVLILSLSIIISFWLPIQSVFFLAAIATIFLNFLRPHLPERRLI